MSGPLLVLASQSPRRAHLLRQMGLEFEVAPADLDETMRTDETARQHVDRLAREKAQLIAETRPGALVIGSDTVVVLEGRVLGKPRDEDEAVRMLLGLQGRSHFVETGIAVASAGQQVRSGVESVRVHFRPFDRTVAEAYVATREPMDKAGAYGIQGFGAALVERIDGDYFAVMGLPIGRLLGLLREAGWRYNFPGLEQVS